MTDIEKAWEDFHLEFYGIPAKTEHVSDLVKSKIVSSLKSAFEAGWKARDAQSGWISIDERHPTLDDAKSHTIMLWGSLSYRSDFAPYETVTEESGLHTLGFIRSPKKTGDFKYFVWSCGCKGEAYECTVLHWMPLPPPLP